VNPLFCSLFFSLLFVLVFSFIFLKSAFSLTPNYHRSRQSSYD
jgi:hypothetical protein